MNKSNILILVAALFLVPGKPSSAFDPTAINWDTVTTSVTWINCTTGREALSLRIDEYDALKNLSPGEVFSRTKFPPGDFKAALIATPSGKTVEEFQLSIRSGHTIIVTATSRAGTASSLVLSPPDKTSSHPNVTFLNTLSEGKVTIPGARSGDKNTSIGNMESKIRALKRKVGFETVLQVTSGERPITCPVKIPPEDGPAEWLVVVHPFGSEVTTTVLRRASDFYDGPENREDSGKSGPP